MNQTIVIAVAALLVGGAGGFIVGHSGNAEEEKSPALVRDAKIRRDGTAGVSGVGDRKRRSRAASSTEEAMGSRTQLSRIQALMDMYAGMDAAQLEAEVGKLDGMAMGDRMMASMLLFSRWAEIDPQGALAHANSMGRGGMFVKPTVLRSWASIDPVNAAKYFEENPREFGGTRFGRGGGEASVIAREWAKVDPAGALEWAQGLEGSDGNSAVISVIGEIAGSNPMEAAQMASTLSADEQGRAYAEIAEQWASKDFAATESWIQSLSGDAKQEALRSAIGVLADSDPKAASAKLSLMSAGAEKDRTVRNVASAWSRESPDQAAAWLLDQTPEGMGDAINDVVQNWTRQDAEGARSFIEAQAVGEVRDSATQAYLRANRSGEPVESMALAETITDESTRSEAVAITAARWMREDEDAAKAYLETSTAVSDEMKKRLLDGGGGWFGGRGGRR